MKSKKLYIISLLTVLTLVLIGCSRNQQVQVLDYFKVSVGEAHSLIVTTDGELYGFGTTVFGVLGNGISDIDISETSPINLMKYFDLDDNEYFIDIASGPRHNIAITSNQRVFSWGWNFAGSVGDGSETIIISSPVEITANFNFNDGETIVDMQVDYHNLVLTSEGRVFGWGLNTDNQLPGEDLEFVSEPIEHIKTPVDMTEVFEESISELRLYYALSDNGRIYGWGTHYEGVTDITHDFNLDAQESIIRLLNGPRFVETSKGRFLYLETETTFPGGIVTNHVIDVTLTLTLTQSEQVIDIFNGHRHMIILTTENLYTFGYNNEGQLGNNSTTAIVPPFIDAESMPASIIDYLSLQANETIIYLSTHQHTVLITSNDRIFTWGKNSHGQLGDGTEEDGLVPTEIAF